MVRAAWIAATLGGLSAGALAAAGAGALPPEAASGIAAGCGGALALTLGLASARPELQLYGPIRCRGPAADGRVALTYDDGPDPASTPALLEALAAAGARATFFVLADRARAHPGLLRDIAADHEVGLHGLTHHPWLTFRDPHRGAEELRRAVDLLGEAGAGLRWYRPPFGVTSPRLFAAVAGAGLTPVWCSLRTYDGVRAGAARLRAVCARAGAGDIVLLHEGPRAAREATPGILADLAGRGLRAVTVRELLN